jgi:trans-aconitate methyltransferase
LGSGKTIYETLARLPAKALESWLTFDHFYSDAAFPAVLPHFPEKGPVMVYDVGGNTGRFSILLCNRNPQMKVTILDLPGQLEMARKNLEKAGCSQQVVCHAMDVKDPQSTFPPGAHIIWMSQFLDCFSENEICSILERARKALDPGGYLYILEPFWDRQKYRTAATSLMMISLYFTTMANGNSRMYRAPVMKALVRQAGLTVLEEIDHLGLCHTLLKCQSQ